MDSDKKFLSKLPLVIVVFLLAVIVSSLLGKESALLAKNSNLRPIAVSPGAEDELLQVNQVCPTFSWSGLVNSVKYQLVVFVSDGASVMKYEQMVSLTAPILQKHIPGAALSWTPSLKEALIPGNIYVWYVAAIDDAGAEIWSEGRMFMVDAGLAYAPIMRKPSAEVVASQAIELRDDQRHVGIPLPPKSPIPPVAAGTPFIICYYDADYQGPSFLLMEGQDCPRLYVENDQISSIRVFNGAMVTVYIDAYAWWIGNNTYREYLTVVKDIPHLSKLKYKRYVGMPFVEYVTDDFNDKISAIMWGPSPFDLDGVHYTGEYVLAYTDINFEGFQDAYYFSTPHLSSLFNDKISSVIAKLPTGPGVKLAKHADYVSPGFFINSSQAVASLHKYNWGDCISSVLFFTK